MNFRKYNKFKSYLDISSMSFLFSVRLFKKKERISVLRCEFYEMLKNRELSQFYC